MGYRTDGFAFTAQWYADDEVLHRWLTGGLDAWALLEPLEAGGHLAFADRVSVNGAPAQSVGSRDALRAQSAAFRRGTVALSSGDPNDPDWLFHLTLDGSSPAIFVGIPKAHATARVRDEVAGWLRAWCGLFDAAGVRFALGAFRPDDVDWPRAIPPRSSPIWQAGAIDQYLGRTWHRADPERAVVLERIEGVVLPPGATRTVDGDVVRVAFAADLVDRASVREARAEHERWITPLVPTELEYGWDEGHPNTENM